MSTKTCHSVPFKVKIEANGRNMVRRYGSKRCTVLMRTSVRLGQLLFSCLNRPVDYLVLNPLKCTVNYIATSNNMKLVHWPLMGGLSHLVQGGGAWVGPQPTQAPPPCTKCNSPPINGQCTNHRIAVHWSAALRF